MKNAKHTVLQLAALTGADRGSVAKWLKLEGVKHAGVRKHGKREFKLYGPEALKIIQAHCKRLDSKEHWAIDPETGMTWAQQKLKEETRKLARENDRVEKSLAGEIMKTEDHHKIISAIVSRLEQVPGKAKSELGLNEVQGAGLRRMLDEARTNAAADIEAL